MRRIIFLTAFVFASTPAFAGTLQVARPDGSAVVYHVDEPNKDSFPILFLLQENTCEGVRSLHEKNAKKLGGFVGSAVVSVEMRGYPWNSFKDPCSPEFVKHNSFDQRLQDLRLVIADVKKNHPKWDRRFAFAGIGEGGVLAARLGSENPETVAVGLFAAGGGYSRAEELRLLLNKQKPLCDVYSPHKLENIMVQMQKEPTPTKSWCAPNFTFKWWASSMRQEAFSHLQAFQRDIYLAHGGRDMRRPVESTDVLYEKLKSAGRAVTYSRYEELDHDWHDSRGESRFFQVMIKAGTWLKDVFHKDNFPDVQDY